MTWTPQEFYAYFSSLAHDFPAPNWAAGCAAAERWVHYHTLPSPEPVLLHAIIQLLFPYRDKGSGLAHFWQVVVHEVAQLPFSMQKPLWQTIYTTDPHPSRPLKQRESVFHMLAEWEHLVSVSVQRPIEAPEIQQLARRCVPHVPGERESFALVSALSTWLERQCPTPVFLTELFAQLPMRELPS
jgi:hypothetical protein